MNNKELEKIKLISIAYNDSVKKSNAIVCLEGDGYERVKQAASLYQRKLAKIIVVSGGFNNPPFSIIANKMAKKLIQKGVLAKSIIIEEKSQNTYEQGIEIMKLVKKNRWKKIIIVASHFHQPRAYLTFLQAMKDTKLKIKIFNAPARELSWFKNTFPGLSRLRLLENELKKIDAYSKKGHLANIKEAINYQMWKEK